MSPDHNGNAGGKADSSFSADTAALVAAASKFPNFNFSSLGNGIAAKYWRTMPANGKSVFESFSLFFIWLSEKRFLSPRMKQNKQITSFQSDSIFARNGSIQTVWPDWLQIF